MAYVDGFVLPVPKDKIAEYRKIAQKAGKIWREHGALEYRECVGEDLDAHEGTVPFGKAVRAKEGETVVIAWIVYKSKRDRDRINKKVMADPRLAKIDPKTMPFDVRRMVYGGFDLLVDAK